MGESHTSDIAQGVQMHTANPRAHTCVRGRKGGVHVRVCETPTCEISVGEACDIHVTRIYARECV